MHLITQLHPTTSTSSKSSRDTTNRRPHRSRTPVPISIRHTPLRVRNAPAHARAREIPDLTSALLGHTGHRRDAALDAHFRAGDVPEPRSAPLLVPAGTAELAEVGSPFAEDRVAEAGEVAMGWVERRGGAPGEDAGELLFGGGAGGGEGVGVRGDDGHREVGFFVLGGRGG